MDEFKIDMLTNKQSNDGTIMNKIDLFSRYMRIHDELGYNIFRKPEAMTMCDRMVDYKDPFDGTRRSMLMFGSNNYLGATACEQAIQKSIEVTRAMGIGSGGAPLLNGTCVYQRELEKLISEYKGFDDAIIFSSGFTANVGVLAGLVRPNNLIVHDKLNHASLMDGSVLTGAKMLRYKHNDLESLERILIENYEQYKDGILVITDGIFSMDGDIANIPGIISIVRKYNAILLIDDAHATGVIGKQGAGTLSHYNITDKRNIVVTGTLSKAIGAVGGFIVAEQKVIDYLRIFARSNVYSTSMPPSVYASAIESIKHIRESSLPEKLMENSIYLSEKLKGEGFNTLNSASCIIPVIIGDEFKLTKMSKEFYQRNIFLNYIFPPVVSPKMSRIRISVMANHTKEDMDTLTDALCEVCEKYEILQSC